jgi:hypothetical protein
VSNIVFSSCCCNNFTASTWVHFKLDLFYTITINYSWLLRLKTVEITVLCWSSFPFLRFCLLCPFVLWSPSSPTYAALRLVIHWLITVRHSAGTDSKLSIRTVDWQLLLRSSELGTTDNTNISELFVPLFNTPYTNPGTARNFFACQFFPPASGLFGCVQLP